MNNIKFEKFLALMAENWSEAFDYLLVSFPLIDRIYAYNNVVMAQVMGDYGLLASDFGLLTALRRSGVPYVLSPTQIRQTMLVSSGGLTKALYRLETKGMVLRIEDEEDKRMKLVQLTAQGKQIIETAVRRVQHNHRYVKSHFSEAEQQQLNALLMKFLAVLEAPHSDGA